MTRSLYRFTFMPQITRSARRWAALSLCLMSFAATHASASVTLLGNRVIYPAEAREKTLQFTNDDGTPALMQIWLDINNPKSTPENADAPFVASPQIFRMNPHSGQMVRLSFVGQPLPRDRESLFYLNFLQVPAVRQTDSDKNKLLLLVTNRLKVFYRPAGLAGDANHVIDRLSLRQAGNALRVDNPTGYYANVSQAAILSGAKRIAIPQADLIPPFSQASWPVNGEVRQVALRVINDYGVEISRTLNVAR
ncbi:MULTISPECIES: fimbrial biogenesis chaperone [Serratia]|uniref:Molecular chaperone n=1 Tax=Serratia marcescens TaxID=615 RepID=A0ABD5BJW7_SERMA|nr:molecular chaperone [Serratia marcescens]MDE5234565.1 molecular chaperone [Serratia marcescens]MDE5257268.1 molecular chaperone [Serratia marcescens]MDQ9380753.1 molecular chaperone [Serratia marcescens]MDQ9402976.1 molecular chaperone [Serratia marcescens]MDQ9418061.1 molecular chaperone [Serratia marcescens]